MRISGPNASAAPAAAPAARRGSSATFTLNESDGVRSASGPAGLRNIGGIDALIALQGLEDPTERRKRAVRHGRVALDALDELKIGLLGGMLTQGTLDKLRSAVGLLKAGSGDDGLDHVLAEIELRVEVEIAKTMAR